MVKINAEPSRVFIENKAVDFRAKIKSVIIINNYICGNLWIKRVGGREMLKASGGNVKCLG